MHARCKAIERPFGEEEGEEEEKWEGRTHTIRIVNECEHDTCQIWFN